MSGTATPNRETKPANKRGAARLAAVQALYQLEVSGSSLTEIVAEYENHRLGREVDGEQYLDADAGWFRSIVAGVVGRQRQIDPLIHAALTPDWPLARLEVLLRAILRAAVFELGNRPDVPARVIINEYVDVAKAFFDEDEPGMVNGVLDRVARKLRAQEVNPGRVGDTSPATEPETDNPAQDEG
ncbi:MAG: transcription antitermination factor NusB [Nitratireductor sp.]|nr:transcription antitermination factor NusB [Nitratireductor sp.]